MLSFRLRSFINTINGGGTSEDGRGVFGGGLVSSRIQYINISSIGNATNFGNLRFERTGCCATSNA